MPFEVKDYIKYFPLAVPIGEDGIFWNGMPDKWSNLRQYGLQLSQRFAMNPAYYARYGMKGHNGTDIQGVRGTPITAPCLVYVSEVQDTDAGYGFFVRAETKTLTVNGDQVKLEMIFGHFYEITAQPYHWYETGRLLGYMDSTGDSTGHHLHFGTRPWIKLYKTSDWKQLAQNNGYFGWIDPEPFMPHLVWDYSELLTDKIRMAQFISEHDLALARNRETGEIGWIYGGKLRTADKERLADLLASYLHRTNLKSVTIDQDTWTKLPKAKF